MKRILEHFDLRDGIFAFAIILIAMGVAFIYWPAALIVTGVLLFGISVLPYLRRNRSD